jgi:hypothetical protein
MKKYVFITIMILSSLVFAGVCDSWSYTNSVTPDVTPIKSGKYYAISTGLTFSTGERMTKGTGFYYLDWKDNFWFTTHEISCSITDIESKFEYHLSWNESCYLITLNCSVLERTQFYAADVKYTDLKGYRTDGTLQWTRDTIGSTDIHCYNKSGMTIVKRVNDPQYCN